MIEFIKKNGIVVAVCTYVAGVVGLVGTEIAKVIRSDKREISYYKKAGELQDAQIDYYRSLSKKES